jgi:hypothetical protein
MASKTYKSLTGVQYTFPVRTKNGEKEETGWISFRGDSDSYTTSSKAVQEAIESCNKFKNGEIGLLRSEPGKEDTEAPASDAPPSRSFPEVTDINMSVEILSAEPFKVDKRSLKTPAAILAKAKENKVAFPNLKFE